MMMVPKIIQYFSQCADILKRLVIQMVLGLSDEIINPPTISDNSLAPA